MDLSVRPACEPVTCLWNLPQLKHPVPSFIDPLIWAEVVNENDVRRAVLMQTDRLHDNNRGTERLTDARCRRFT